MQTTLGNAAGQRWDVAPLHGRAQVKCLAKWHGRLCEKTKKKQIFLNQLCCPYPSFTQAEIWGKPKQIQRNIDKLASLLDTGRGRGMCRGGQRGTQIKICRTQKQDERYMKIAERCVSWTVLPLLKLCISIRHNTNIALRILSCGKLDYSASIPGYVNIHYTFTPESETLHPKLHHNSLN